MMNKILILCVVLVGCVVTSKKDVLVTGAYYTKPYWCKWVTKEAEDFIYFVGVSDKKVSINSARNGAIEDGAQLLLQYAGVKNERQLKRLCEEFVPKITNLSDKKVGFYGITIDDFYWEKYMTKGRIFYYKGYVLLKWPLTTWNRFLNDVKRMLTEKFEQMDW